MLGFSVHGKTENQRKISVKEIFSDRYFLFYMK